MSAGGARKSDLASYANAASKRAARKKTTLKVGAEAKEDAPQHRFAVGDRVIYHPKSTGNMDLDGWHGTIIYIDEQEACYTVEFDELYIDAVTDVRARKNGIEPRAFHSWFSKEENLRREPRRKPQEEAAGEAGKNEEEREEGHDEPENEHGNNPAERAEHVQAGAEHECRGEVRDEPASGGRSEGHLDEGHRRGGWTLPYYLL